MAAVEAVRALIVDDDPSMFGEFKRILCANGPFAPDMDSSFGAVEQDLIGAAVGHRNFPTVEITSFRSGEEAVRAAHDALEYDQPFLIAYVDSELKAGLGGIETAERLRAADARMQIVIMSGRSPLHPVDMVARIPPADRIAFVKKPFHPFEIQNILIGCRHRNRRELLERSHRSGNGGGHASMLQAILDLLPGGALVFDRHDKLVAANAEMRRLFPDIADMLVSGASYLDINRQLYAESPVLWGATNGAHIWRHHDNRWALVSEKVASTGETYCLFVDISDHKHRDADRWRSMYSARLTRIFTGLCETIDGLTAGLTAGAEMDPLLSRLRTVAQQQHLSPQAIDLSRYLSRAARRIRRDLPKGVGLEAVIDSGLWLVVVDPDGLSRALAELTANACDAMPGGGQIHIEAVNVRVSAGSEVASLGLAMGDYVRVAVQDTGKGLPPEIADQALVPFQSRGNGQHFGLGLPIVHAFAIESGGWFEIAGSSGSGTTVRLYLPIRAPAANAAVTGERVPPAENVLPSRFLRDPSAIAGPGRSS